MLGDGRRRGDAKRGVGRAGGKASVQDGGVAGTTSSRSGGGVAFAGPAGFADATTGVVVVVL